MSDMKCPFCQQGLQPVSIFDNQDKRCVWYCPNCATNERLWVMANERIWLELIRTRKALEGAKEALNDIQFTDDGNRIVDVRSFAHHALEQITALEQKDK